MLHIHFVENFKEPGNAKRFGGYKDIKVEFCSYIEDIYHFGHPAYLRAAPVCEYLKELYGVEWVDDYTVMMNESYCEPQRAIATALDTHILLTMLLIHYQSSPKRRDVYLPDFVPWISDLKWLSEHGEMTIYIPKERGIPVDIYKQSDKKAMEQAGLFDFVYDGVHDSCSWAEFVLKYKVGDDEYITRRNMKNKQIQMWNIRRYCSRIDRISICFLESGRYENYDTIKDVPDTYDEKYLYGFGVFESEFRDHMTGCLEFKTCLELMMSENPKEWGY
jgi:hypothetical protein